MRIYVKLGVMALAALGTAGCSDSNMSEGVPAKVDMSKDYSPQVPLPTMSPKDMAKGRERAKTGAEAPKIEDLPGAKK